MTNNATTLAPSKITLDDVVDLIVEHNKPKTGTLPAQLHCFGRLRRVRVDADGERFVINNKVSVYLDPEIDELLSLYLDPTFNGTPTK